MTYDKDNPYAVSANDYQVLGHQNPDWTMGFKNTFTYKNFDLSIYMYWRWGQTIYYDMLGYYDRPEALKTTSRRTSTTGHRKQATKTTTSRHSTRQARATTLKVSQDSAMLTARSSRLRT